MEGLLIIAALFFIALPLISFVMVLNANNRLKRMEDRFKNTAKVALRHANLYEETLTRLEAIEGHLYSGGEIPLPSSMPEKSVDDKVSEPITEEIPDEEPVLEKATDEASKLESAEDKENELEIAANEEMSEQETFAAAQSTDTYNPKTAKLDFESLIGGQWSVLLGGFALALGLIFLVQYTIEAGLLGLGPRIILGFLFSGLLFGAGEWLRRSDEDFDLPIYAKADVPGILTGAGAIGAFTTLYAAHALYGFVGQGTAFVGLTLIGIATMLLSSIHGPKLAAIGVLGAYVAPLLVDSQTPNPIALALHVIAVTAVVMAMASLRKWTWLAVAASIFSTLWIIIAAITPGPSVGLAGAMMVISITAIFVISYGYREFQKREIIDVSPNWVSNFSFALLTIGFVIQLIANQQLAFSLL